MLTQPQPAPVQTSKPGYRETTVLLVLDYVVLAVLIPLSDIHPLFCVCFAGTAESQDGSLCGHLHPDDPALPVWLQQQQQ